MGFFFLPLGQEGICPDDDRTINRSLGEAPASVCKSTISISPGYTVYYVAQPVETEPCLASVLAPHRSWDGYETLLKNRVNGYREVSAGRTIEWVDST